MVKCIIRHAVTRVAVYLLRLILQITVTRLVQTQRGDKDALTVYCLIKLSDPSSQAMTLAVGSLGTQKLIEIPLLKLTQS